MHNKRKHIIRSRAAIMPHATTAVANLGLFCSVKYKDGVVCTGVYNIKKHFSDQESKLDMRETSSYKATNRIFVFSKDS